MFTASRDWADSVPRLTGTQVLPALDRRVAFRLLAMTVTTTGRPDSDRFFDRSTGGRSVRGPIGLRSCSGVEDGLVKVAVECFPNS